MSFYKGKIWTQRQKGTEVRLLKTRGMPEASESQKRVKGQILPHDPTKDPDNTVTSNFLASRAVRRYASVMEATQLQQPQEVNRLHSLASGINSLNFNCFTSVWNGNGLMDSALLKLSKALLPHWDLHTASPTLFSLPPDPLNILHLLSTSLDVLGHHYCHLLAFHQCTLFPLNYFLENPNLD